MTKAELSQYCALQREIKLIEAEMKETEALATGGVHQFGRYPKMLAHTDRVGVHGAQIADLNAKLEKRLAQSVDELNKLVAFIDGIEDAMVRTVFKLRYVHNCSWQQVAVRLGGNTADSTRMMHNRYLDKQSGAKKSA